MSLYRLDYLNDDGTTAEPVTNFVGSDFLARHMTTARGAAIEVAAKRGRAILITRIGKAGALRATLIIMPDGTAKRPPNTKSTDRAGDCRKGSGVACFCTACRADRREARR
jgi:hypothetical protein